MRVCLQRVSEAWVSVLDPAAERRETGRIGPGLLALAGFAPGDDRAALEWMAAKIADLRGVRVRGRRRLRPIVAGNGRRAPRRQPVHALRRRVKGGAPISHRQHATPPPRSGPRVLRIVRGPATGKVETGEFGARMEVGLVNDGPVTLWLER